MDLCKYKNILGTPGQGIHSYRFAGVALVDVFLTIVAAIIIAKIADRSFLGVLAVLLILAEILHIIFCVDTPVALLIKKIA